MELTHFDLSGRARMVDVGEKDDTRRTATAGARIHMKPETLRRILDRTVEKGDVFAVAQVAGIMAAKHTPDIIPMCHPLLLTGIDLSFAPDEADSAVRITATVRTRGKTGVEMEALHAVSAAALTIYDMCKAIDRAMRIDDIRVLHKSGGKSGEYNAEPDPAHP